MAAEQSLVDVLRRFGPLRGDAAEHREIQQAAQQLYAVLNGFRGGLPRVTDDVWQDVVQHFMLRLMRMRERVPTALPEDPHAAVAYVRQALRNRVIDELRTRPNIPVEDVPQELVRDGADDPETALQREQLLQRVGAVLPFVRDVRVDLNGSTRVSVEEFCVAWERLFNKVVPEVAANCKAPTFADDVKQMRALAEGGTTIEKLVEQEAGEGKSRRTVGNRLTQRHHRARIRLIEYIEQLRTQATQELKIAHLDGEVDFAKLRVLELMCRIVAALRQRAEGESG